MALYLVQHALSLPKAQDPEKGISPAGRADTERIAGVAQGYGVPVSKIIHSGKKRARETAGIFSEVLSPPQGVATAQGLGPLDDVTALAGSLKNGPEDLMLVGHLPFLERLTAMLVTGQTDKPIFRFQNSGIVCLENDPDKGGWVVAWALMPNIG